MTHFPPPLSSCSSSSVNSHSCMDYITLLHNDSALECTGETPQNTALICHLQHHWECARNSFMVLKVSPKRRGSTTRFLHSEKNS